MGTGCLHSEKNNNWEINTLKFTLSPWIRCGDISTDIKLHEAIIFFNLENMIIEMLFAELIEYACLIVYKV